MENNKEFLGVEPVGKLLFRLSVPTVAAQLINMLYNIIDRIYSRITYLCGKSAFLLLMCFQSCIFNRD